jgi:membrane-associated protease RseP (regulator of RpoE activity)
MANPYLGWEIFVVVVLGYAVIVWGLYRSGRIGRDKMLSLFGPALMIKTGRGRAWLDRMGRFRRFWTPVADIGILLAAVTMVSVVIVLIVDAAAAFRIPSSEAPSPAEALGIPGLNPIIPITYGIVALVVAVVLHELFHGIIARSQGIGVKSLGVLWLVVPVGAFVEQDDQEMLAAPLRKRDRVAAAGILANFILAGIFALVVAGLMASSVQPNATGVGIAGVVANSPAQNASLVPGDIITQIDQTPTPTTAALTTYLDGTHPGQAVNLTFYSVPDQGIVHRTAVLESAETYTNSPADASRGFLGISATFLTPSELQSTLVSPWSSPNGPVVGLTYWIVLPLAGLQPIQGSTASFYHLTGPLAGVDPTTFWFILNLFYWLAWMDLLLGISNALPLFPLDGGLLFRDFAQTVVQRVRRGWDVKRAELVAGRAAVVASVVTLVLLLWQFVVPRLVP